MIWLIGNKGMLGTELSGHLQHAGLPWVGTDREVDILDPAALRTFVAGKDLRWLVNCAAYTAVDKAEEEEALALRLNAEGPANLATLAAGLGARLLHLSTDYVFDGSASTPYRESDPPAPAGAYGRTKEEGERRVMAAAPSSVILRTAWLYGRHGPNFVYTMLRLLKERDSLGVVADQHGSPTSAADLSAAIIHMITLPQLPPGIYNYTNEGQTTWYHFACEIHRLARQRGLLERDCPIHPLTTEAYPTKAARPAYSVLSKEKIKNLGVQVPGWEESLKGHLEELTSILRRQRQWFRVVEYDLRSAEIEASFGRFRSCAFWCQQSVEKTLKSLIEFDERPLPVHDVFKLAHKLRLPLEDRHKQLLKLLGKLYTESRYDLNLEIDEGQTAGEESARLLEASKEFIQWARTQNRLPIV